MLTCHQIGELQLVDGISSVAGQRMFIIELSCAPAKVKPFVLTIRWWAPNTNLGRFRVDTAPFMSLLKLVLPVNL